MSTVRVKQRPTEWVVKCPATGFIQIPRDGRWSFNGDLERPTFSPSVNETMGPPGSTLEELRAGKISSRNHVVITSGRIKYCDDCTHEFAGQTVEIPPLTEAEALLEQSEAA